MTDKEQCTVNELSIRLNSVLDKVTTHIEDGKGWRTTIVVLAVSLVLQIVGFAYFFGELTHQQKMNTEAIKQICVVTKRLETHVAVDEARWDIFPIPKAIK